MYKTYIKDNALSVDECDELINTSKSSMGEKLSSPWNYSFYDFPKENELLASVGTKLVSEYVQLYPEINLTFNRWYLEPFRIKKFKPGEYYDDWHSEQGFNLPRIASVLVYLSDHNCGTEFCDNEIVYSKKGRAMIFPASWTHTHRGQPCPENKPRFIMSSYIVLMDDQ